MAAKHNMDMATLAHVAVGCNAASRAFCGNSASALGQSQSQLCGAFAALNSVTLVSRSRDETSRDAPSSLRIEATLQHRVASTNANTRITSVYLHADESQAHVLAGDSEGRVFLWTRAEQPDPWRLVQLPTRSIASVAALTAVCTPQRWIYAVSLSDGSLLALAQENEAQDVQEIARLELGVKRILESVALTCVPAAAAGDENDTHRVLLAAGGVDHKVYLYELTGGLHELFALEGHRGWIRHVAFEPSSDTSSSGSDYSCMLASGSQDERIRLWKLSVSPGTADSTAAASANGFQALSPDGRTSYTVSFDALLLGHEDWVTSLAWTAPPQVSESGAARLVSTSMDNSLIVWEKDATRGSWSPALRVGDMGGNGLLASAVWAIGSRLDLLALNFSGQLERWTQQPQSTIFLPGLSLSGHCGPVTDVSWSPRGDYLLSVSLDQTARIWAPVLKSHGQVWAEISRAQVHGYDLNCASFLRDQSHNDRFVSGADEKILRVFEAPDEIHRLIRHQEEDPEERSQPRVAHAYLPELSLTNKTNDVDAATDELGYVSVEYQDKSLVRLPVGDTLARKTLWPEQRKLYGHANELLCVTSDHSGTLLASACKSREERFAGVWLWNTSDWSAHQSPLAGHKSSVVQLAFSPDDQLLLSVSKDRHVCVYEKQAPSGEFVLQKSIKAHKRIIWSCSWSPDSKIFVTGSRDQTFTLWGRRSGQWTSLAPATTMDHAVTAVAFAPWSSSSSGSYLLTVGLENGSIHLFTVSAAESSVFQCTLLHSLDLAICPSASVARLTWSPDSSKLLLAAASADISVRVFCVLPPQDDQ